ncbi:Brevican core protein [Triplophysa tibetana]|uniref:Brevican core protein n=1 Tax=Triplophysa tibetana TaxID=1572043 RepID=A0A5A9P9J5_9TELE|nr:Brevican core protein [Triplophysa tibetana]
MDMSLFVLLLLSGLLCSASGRWLDYHYINQSMSWSEAQSYCRERFTDLASVDSMNDVNRTINSVNDGYSGSVWIGLKRGTQSRWVWSGANTISEYINWDPGQPNQPLSGFCVYSSNGGWHDMPCDSKLPFVCYNESTKNIMVNSYKNWTDAQSYCRQYHTDLASISSPEEQQQLYNLSGYSSDVWIGLSLDSWQWSDQWNLFFRNWAAGYTSQTSGSGDCAVISTTDSGKWIQDGCDLHRPFLCYGLPGSKPLYRPHHYVNTRMTWSEAQSYCRLRFTDLATVDSIDDVNRMINKVNDGYSTSVWIGLKRGTQSRWGWSNGDTYTQYRGWSRGEPSGDGACGELKSGAWNDLQCNTNNNFVCYNKTIGNILIETQKTWTDAQSYCRQYHTDLASISSPEEQQQLYNLAGYSSHVWIGLFSDSWQWSDQWSLFFRHWAAGQPSASGDCAVMSAATPGKWTHESCDLKRPFFCHGWPKPLYRHYHYINESRSWSDAQSYCRERFTDLATLDSMDEVNRTVNTVNDGYSGSVWIGLKRGTQSRWVWSMENNTLSQYINWKAGEPNFDGDCVGSSNGSWFDETCSTLLPFVCYNGGAGFIFINITRTWRDAQNYCRQHHTDLTSVSSPGQQRLINDKSSVWIGLFLHSWQWSDNWSLSFRYWTTGQPSNSSASGNCVAMATNDSGKWAHDNCDQRFPFICHGRPKPLYRLYHYINTTLSWSAAQMYCRERFTDLATVDSIDDVNRTINTVNDGYSGSVWIGLKRGTQSRWGWSHGDDTYTQYRGLSTGDPSGDICGELYYGAWNGISCINRLRFVCYNETIGNILIQTQETWKDAQSYCRQYHTDLASISSPEEQQQLNNLAGYGSRVWIGLFSDSWQWSDQWSLFFRNWAAGQPSASGDCVAMSTTDSWKWTQYDCDHQRPFICYGRPKLHRHYLYVHKNMSWSEAQSYCRERFTDLATVDSMNDVNKLMNTVKSWYSGSLWIGLKMKTQSRWLWSSGYDTLKQYSGWQSGEPNGDGACVFFANGFWRDYSCSIQLFFVCYNGYGNIVIPIWKNWIDAQSYCRQYHTDLATISSPEEQKQLYSVVGNGPWVWIGLFSDSWQWSDQWSLFNFRYWATGFTSLSSGSGNCVAMSTTGSGKWIQNSCDKKFPFICYGDHELIKRQIGKLLLSCDVLRSPAKKCSSGEPLLKTAILNKIAEINEAV